MALPSLHLHDDVPRARRVYRTLPDRERDRWRFLAELGVQLAEADDVDGIIAAALGNVVPQFADECVIRLGALPASNDALPALFLGSDHARQHIPADDEHLVDLRESAPHSVIVAPLRHRGRHLGMAYFATTAVSARVYRPRDLSLAAEITQRIATSADRLLLERSLRDAVLQARTCATRGDCVALPCPTS